MTYRGEDTGYSTAPVKPPLSSRRYDRPPITTSNDVLEDIDTVEPSTRPVVARASRTSEQPMIESELGGRRRPNTDEYPINYSVVRPILPTLKPQRLPRRHTRRRILRAAGVVLGIVAAGAGVDCLLSWVSSAYTHTQNQLQEGLFAATPPLSLQCGHNDSALHKTQIRAQILANGQLTVVEWPGGKGPAHTIDAGNLRDHGYQGSLADIHIDLTPKELSSGKYQISMHVTAEPVSLTPGAFQQRFDGNWILVDSGKGYFVGANRS